MPSPVETTFRAALAHPAFAVPDGLTDGAGRPAGRRFAVYRNNIAVSLREALETAFPAVRALIGAENFAMAAQAYVRRSPPVDPRLFRYGEGFADYLATVSQLRHLGYLPDVARLETALRQSYHAADAAPFDPATLSGIDANDIAALHLPIAPATRVVRSPWPALSIHRYATNPGAPKPAAGGEDILIARPGFDPQMHLLPPGAATLILALRAGMPLGPALDCTSDTIDLPTTLSLLLQSGALGQPKGAKP